MKKHLSHHTFTKAATRQEDGTWKRNTNADHGGRVASRKLTRPTKKIVAPVTPSGMAPGVTPDWMRRTRPKGSRLGMGD